MSDEYHLHGPGIREWNVSTPEHDKFMEELANLPPPRLEAQPGCCEEASVLSHSFYIPCNRPATQVVTFTQEGPYRMCAMCADHNVRNRGATHVGPYVCE